MRTPALFVAGLVSLLLAAPLVADDTTTRPDRKAESAAQTTGEFLSDAALTAKVKTALIAEKDLESMAIDVDSRNGVVTLRGELPTAAAVTKAETATRNVKGVKQVLNQLSVKAS